MPIAHEHVTGLTGGRAGKAACTGGPAAREQQHVDPQPVLSSRLLAPRARRVA